VIGNLNENRPISDSCGHKFKATNGCNKAEAAATTKKGVDETRVMAVTCFHGIGVRYVNLYGGNERFSHGIRLIEAMHSDCPNATKMRVCYDVACESESSIKRLDADWIKDVSIRIGRFHLYGHHLRCHILYNLLRTEGFGLMVGEEVEQLWSMLRHLIPSGRYSSGPRRTQKIDSCGIILTQRQRENFGKNLSWGWEKMKAIEGECGRVLDQVLGKTVLARTDRSGREHPERLVTAEYLNEQAAKQVAYYKSSGCSVLTSLVHTVPSHNTVRTGSFDCCKTSAHPIDSGGEEATAPQGPPKDLEVPENALVRLDSTPGCRAAGACRWRYGR
jgi:hypothetical protein